MKKQKVLIAIGDVAAGHRSAANALEQAFKIVFPDKYEVKTIDFFIEVDQPPFNTSDVIHELVSRNSTIESIYNFVLTLANTKIGYDILSTLAINSMYEETKNIIDHEKPDVLISIHPITNILISKYKEEYPNTKTVVVITDLISIPRGWASPNAGITFAPTPDIVNLLVKYGVDIRKIVYPLFPIKPSIEDFRKKEVVLEEIGLDPKKKTIFLMGGGLAIKTMLKAIKVLKEESEYQIIVLCGKLEALKEDLQSRFRYDKNVAILGYVNNVQDYINSADLIVSKPGPASILEIELLKKKCILTHQVGRQEDGNIDFALRNPHFRYIGSDYGKLIPTIREMLEMDIPESKQPDRRSFDECEKIVREIDGR